MLVTGNKSTPIHGLQSISRDAPDNFSHPRQLDPRMELTTYSIVLYLQHGRHDIKCKPSISIAYVTQYFHKFIVSLFCPIQPPTRAALSKSFVEAPNKTPEFSTCQLKITFRHSNFARKAF